MNQEVTTEDKKTTMSAFCETLMDVTSSVASVRTPMDAAIILCTDGNTIASRQCGIYPTVLRMLYSKMMSDDKFAEVIMEASMKYSQQLLGKFHKPFKEDLPYNQATVKPIN